MADLLLSAVIPSLVTKAAGSLMQQIGEMWGIDDQRERLCSFLLEIQAVLPDAEDRANSNKDFDIYRLVKLIIDLIIRKDCGVSIDNGELLKTRLQEVLGGKRYLLVLDDVWNENVNEWERLRALLNCGDFGSVVLVTTRSDRVAFIMGTVESYNLGCLSADDSWNLFCKRAFSMGLNETPEVVETGKKMVQNCGGLPRAINTLGSLMSEKHEVREWLVVYEKSRIWERKSADNNVFSVLRLSYDHLPPHIKLCFAFCAVFSKDYEMEKDKLIQYWMANGFIPSDGLGTLEMKGNDIFKELVRRSFFQDVKQVCPDYK